MLELRHHQQDFLAARRWLLVHKHTIPGELREQPFVLWRAEPQWTKEGVATKPKKVPYMVSYPSRRASTTNPATWAPFDDAWEAYVSLLDYDNDPSIPERGRVVGLGVVLTRNAEVTCIDLDSVLINGTCHPRIEWLVERCNSFTEVSPSGNGLHLFVKGTVPRDLKKAGQIEVYSNNRYICVTGVRWRGGPRVTWQQPFLDFLTREAGDVRGCAAPYPGSSRSVSDDLAAALLRKLQIWGVSTGPIRRWADGYLAELDICPWAVSHTTGNGGAAVMIHASGAFDFTCLHAHCSGRGWADFRSRMAP
jgi:hypothetical protein